MMQCFARDQCDDFSTPRLNMAKTSSKFSSSVENLIESNISSSIKQLLNEVEYDVKNYADLGGACHRLGTAYIDLQIW